MFSCFSFLYFFLPWKINSFFSSEAKASEILDYVIVMKILPFSIALS